MHNMWKSVQSGIIDIKSDTTRLDVPYLLIKYTDL